MPRLLARKSDRKRKRGGASAEASLAAAAGEMSRRGSSSRGRRGKHRLGPRGFQPSWRPGQEEEEAWGRPPPPRRSRWDGPPGPADWGPEELGPPFPFAPRDWDQPPPEKWGGPPLDHGPGEPWDGPDSQTPWDYPPGDGGESFEPPHRPWMPRRGGRQWSGPKELPWQQDPDEDRRAWGSPGREEAWEPRPGSPGRARRRQGESWSPSREHRSLASSGREIREESRGSISDWGQTSREHLVGGSSEIECRWDRDDRKGIEHHSPPRKQRSWGSPKREARQERFGSTRHHARQEGQVNPDEGGSRRSFSRGRERNDHNSSRDEGSLDREWHRPSGEAGGQGSPMRDREVESIDGRGAERESQGRGEEKRTDTARNCSPEVSTSFGDLGFGSSAVPTEWTPCESAVNWWEKCRRTLSKKMGDQLRSLCPRPTLHDRSSETPQVNPPIISLLKPHQEKELRKDLSFTLMLQGEVLDMLGPAMTIYEMAEEAMEKHEPVDPMELREWSRRLIRFIGSINTRLTYKNRSLVLGAINPRLKMVVTKMNGQSTKGMLFAEDNVRLLKEIILRFPQLTDVQKNVPKRGFQSFTRGAYYKQAPRRPFQGSHFKPRGIGKRATADWRAEQSHSQEAEGH